MEQVGFLVLGGGIAGLSAAVRLAAADTVLVVTKEGFAQSGADCAEGAMGSLDGVAGHLEDTISAGDGLVDREAAAVLFEEAPARVAELLARSSDPGFAPVAGEPGRTGEIASSLLRRARASEGITLREFTTAADLITEEVITEEVITEEVRTKEVITKEVVTKEVITKEARGIKTVVGAILLDREGKPRIVRARAVLLATGGAGQVYSETTNPPDATGDGIAMAYRAGAALSDMEFYQFHPTAFGREGAPRFPLGDSLRGAGAWLVDARGECFMQRYHPLLELAPRDVVARAIARELLKGPVYLDMRHCTGDLKARFPGISKVLAGYGLELGRDLIPVRPAAHFLMGGIQTDLDGRTTLPGLFAAGEAACTGVHGANQLAGNSVLEGLVFGARAAEAMLQGRGNREQGRASEVKSEPNVVLNAEALEEWIAEVRAIMWEDAGVLRDAEGLKRAQARLDALIRGIPRGYSRRAVEARSLYTIASVLVASATAREESRGAHFRGDFPDREPAARHSVMERGKLSFVEQPAAAQAAVLGGD